MENQEKIKEISINNEVYVLKSLYDNAKMAESEEKLPYVIIRTYSAGVHMGYLKSKNYTQAGTVVELVKTRRIWYWSGAMTLSQLALEGTNKPNDCKFSVEIPTIEINAIEIVPTTEIAFKNLTNVKVWKQ
jgi:hypothetical protein